MAQVIGELNVVSCNCDSLHITCNCFPIMERNNKENRVKNTFNNLLKPKNKNKKKKKTATATATATATGAIQKLFGHGNGKKKTTTTTPTSITDFFKSIVGVGGNKKKLNRCRLVHPVF
ncbi:hypothetical protein ACFE04_020460 [Oxalis oulophora]